MSRLIAVDICNTIADISSELGERLGELFDPTTYQNPLLNNRFFKDNPIFSYITIILFHRG